MGHFRNGIEAEADYRAYQARKHRRQHAEGGHREKRRRRCWDCKGEVEAIRAAERRAAERALYELQASGEQEPEHLRRHAIWSALKYGLLPWHLYERQCHYAPMGYFAHLRLNLAYAWRWCTRSETNSDRCFELEVNPQERTAR